MSTLDSIIPKLLREYEDTDDPARRAELVQVLQDYGAFPAIFALCVKAISLEREIEESGLKGSSAEATKSSSKRKTKADPIKTSDEFSATII